MQFVGLQATITDVLVRASLLNGAHWTVVVRPAQPWVEFTGAKSTLEVAQTYLVHGVEHILFGIDHLLFVFWLLLIVQDRWMLLKTVTSFTLAHSLTLAIATLGYASAPMLPLNAAIALSILFSAEIVRSWREANLTLRHPWLWRLCSRLHGFGFASALAGAGLPRQSAAGVVHLQCGVDGADGVRRIDGTVGSVASATGIRWPRWVERVPGYVVGTLGASGLYNAPPCSSGGSDEISLAESLTPRRAPHGRAGLAGAGGVAMTALAHTKGGEDSVSAAVCSTVSGLDHLLAMLAVGYGARSWAAGGVAVAGNVSDGDGVRWHAGAWMLLPGIISAWRCGLRTGILGVRCGILVVATLFLRIDQQRYDVRNCQQERTACCTASALCWAPAACMRWALRSGCCTGGMRANSRCGSPGQR
jgi:hydrogenase/urease accessory protein HupE